MGREIVKPSDLASFPKDTVVLIASIYLEDIYHTLLKNGIAEDCIFAVCMESELRFDRAENIFDNLRLQEWDLHAVVRDTKEKPMVIYGYGTVVEALLPKLKILGICQKKLY